MTNVGEHQSDYEQHAALTERKVLASVMHMADQFGLNADTNAGDRSASVPQTMKDIRTLSGLSEAMARAMTAATADDDVTVANNLVHNILDRVIGDRPANDFHDDDAVDTNNVIDNAFVSSIMQEASQSISRCIGVHDLHLDSSKAMLDGCTTAEDTQTQQQQQQGDGDGVDADADPTDDDSSNSKSSQTEQKKQIDRLVNDLHADESITDIIDYGALHFAEEPALPYGDAKLLSVPSASRAETVGGGQPMDMEQILARKAAQHGGKGTWSRIKKVFSTISGRSQLQIPR